MSYYIKIDPSGEMNSGRFGEEENTLQWMQQQVNGPIEVVTLPHWPDVIMLINEEGKLRNLQPNIIATIMAGLAPYDFAVGSAVLLKTAGEDFAGLSFDEAITLLNTLESVLK